MLIGALWFLEEGVFSSSAGEGQTWRLSCVHQVNLMFVSWFCLVRIGMWQLDFVSQHGAMYGEGEWAGVLVGLMVRGETGCVLLICVSTRGECRLG